MRHKRKISIMDEKNDIERPASSDDVAIVGMSGRFPSAPDITSFWDAIVHGRNCITRWQQRGEGDDRIPAGGLIADLDMFDAPAFGLTPAEADLLDPQHRVFAESCWLALEDAAVVPSETVAVSVYAAASPSEYEPEAPGDVNGQYQRMIANAPDFLATRIAHLLDLRGEAINVQTACSSSLVAVHLACQSLQGGNSDIALAGGVSITPSQHLGYRYQEGMVASADGSSRPFDELAQGAVPGNGSAVVVLQRLGDALAEGRRVHAVIRSSAVNQDGRAKTSFMAPSVAGQSELIASALAQAGVPAHAIQYLEAHGTGTRIGDPIEVEAATEAFRLFTDKAGFCSLGSLKASFGHLDRAAGVAGLIKAALVVREGVAPPLVGFNNANPDLELDTSPFLIDTQPRVLGGSNLHRAGVSAFGVGGTNAHVILESPPTSLGTVPGTGSPMVFPVSAHSAEVLTQLTNTLGESISANGGSLESVARTLGSGRVARPVRSAVVVERLEEAPHKFVGAQPHTSMPIAGELAMLFAGQGAQTAYRPLGLMNRYPVFREEIKHFADVLDCSPARLLEGVSGDSPEVRAFAYQPSLGAVQVALARLIEHFGIRVGAYCGSSIGEYAAAHLAGVFDHEGLMRALQLRAEVMAATLPGRLLSVSCSAATAEDLLVPGMELAGDNAPDRALISGPLHLVERQLLSADRAGVRARVLPGSIAPHNALMDDAAQELSALIKPTVPSVDLQVPVVSTLTGRWVGAEELADPMHWARHMRRPIRFREALDTLTGAGYNRFVEASPGGAMTSLVLRRDAPNLHAVSVGGAADSDAEESLLSGCAELWTSGIDVEWDVVNGVGNTPYAELPGYPFSRRRHWSHAPAERVSGTDSGTRDGVIARPAWRPSADCGNTSKVPMPAVVTLRGDCALASHLSESLREAGVVVRRAIETKLGSSGDAAPEADHVLIDLTAVDGPEVQSPFDSQFDIEAWLRRRLLGPATDVSLAGADRVLLVSRGVRAVSPDDDPLPEAAGLVGLLRCLPHERPGTTASWLDLDPSTASSEAAQQVLDEIRRSPDRDSALRGGIRYELRYEQFLPQAPSVLREHGTYLVLGGTGYLGAVVVDAISQEVPATIVLAGRNLSRVASPGNAGLIARARERGCEVLKIELDVTDYHSMNCALDELEKTHGRVDGVFHLAANTEVSEFALMEEEDVAIHSRMAGAKVLGAQNLARAVAGRELDFVCLFSSLSTVIGSLRFGAYVSANAFLDALAERSLAIGGIGGSGRCNWISVVWDGWAEDGRPSASAIGQKDGSNLLRKALRAGIPVVTATARDVEGRREDVRRDLRAVANSAATSETEDSTTASVARIVSEVTGYESVNVHDQFVALGIDSLQMMQIAARLRRGLSHTVALGTLLRSGSIAELSDALQVKIESDPEEVVQRATTIPRGASESIPFQELSTVQERMWFLDQLDPRGNTYNVPFGWRLPPDVSASRAREVVDAVLDLHPVLRSSYATAENGQAFSVVHESASVEILEADSSFSDREVRCYLEKPFDLGQGSTRVLIRVESSVEIIFACHHISIDAWSVKIIHKDIANILEKETPERPTGSYKDFVDWEISLRNNPMHAKSLSFWDEELSNIELDPPPADFLQDSPGQLGSAAELSVYIESEIISRLHQRLPKEGATLFAAGLTAVSIALSSWQGRGSVTLGANVANRPTPEMETVVGMFVDPVLLVLQPKLSEGEPTLGSALKQVRRTLEGAMAHSDVPFADVVQSVARGRRVSGSVINVIVTMFDAEAGVSRDLVSLDFDHHAEAKFPLAIELLPKDGGLVLHAIYASNLYSRASVQRVLSRAARYLAVLGTSGPSVLLDELDESSSTRGQKFAKRFQGLTVSPEESSFEG